MFILGAGMAGCLAGIMNGGATILEASSKLPNNHHGVLRFRTDNISKITGIPFKQVKVRKGIWLDGVEQPLSIRLANMYSMKVAGCIQDRSINNLEPVERWIAPDDLHDIMGDMVKNRIHFNYKVGCITNEAIKSSTGIVYHARHKSTPIISTIPMPIIANIIGITAESLEIIDNHSSPIYVAKVRIPGANIHQTIYYPGGETDIYRASMVGDILIIESMSGDIEDGEMGEVFYSFGIESVANRHFIHGFKQEMGKFSAMDDTLRKNFMLKISQDFNIWSLGRYACWRPSLLLDDVYTDILKIRSMIGGHHYDTKRLSI